MTSLHELWIGILFWLKLTFGFAVFVAVCAVLTLFAMGCQRFAIWIWNKAIKRTFAAFARAGRFCLIKIAYVAIYAWGFLCRCIFPRILKPAILLGGTICVVAVIAGLCYLASAFWSIRAEITHTTNNFWPVLLGGAILTVLVFYPVLAMAIIKKEDSTTRTYWSFTCSRLFTSNGDDYAYYLFI